MAQPPAAQAISASPSSPAGRDSPSSSRSLRQPPGSLVIGPSEISNTAISSSAASPSTSKRSSFIENVNLRSYPSSPRAQRTPSFSASALTELLMHPATKASEEDPRFKGRDWRTIQVAEIIDPAEARFVELDTSIEDTTKLLIRSGPPNVVLIRKSRKTRTVVDTFDYTDLTTYLLIVLGLSQPDGAARAIAERTRAGDVIPVGKVTSHLGARDEPAFLHDTSSLAHAMEVLGSGHHRVLVCKEGTTEVVGVLSQLRLVRFFWENHRNFTAMERLYARTLHDLKVGAKEVLAIGGEQPLSDALRLMHDEGITSLPVLDGQRNVVGNISHVDTKLLTDTSAIPLLSSSCIHFISVILSERGLFDGMESFPVFHVTHFSTLAHAVAKLCATRSHRMWIVDAPSPSTSVPPSPGPQLNVPPFSMGNATNLHSATTPIHARHGSSGEAWLSPPHPTGFPPVSVTSGQVPGQALSGSLSGVISLTDVLNLFARASGLSPRNPEVTRSRRRQSSASSTHNSTEGISTGASGSGPGADSRKDSDTSRSASMSSKTGRGSH